MSEQTAKLPIEGERIGSGIVLSLISTGGSAYVYKTWAETMEIHRAVKVMSPDAETDVRDRFSTEARINSKLIHPNIVHCYNFGQTTGGLPYIEMEYIAGPSLASVISKRGGLPLPVALVIIRGILEALTYAHSVKYTLYDKQHVGIIHRDLKPANIIINTDGIPKLMDFGIARPVDFSIHTVAGTVPGTVAYMSPEACAGGDLDFRSDIYQVGICLYEILSGVPAFPQMDLTSLLAAKASGKIPPLETLVRNLPIPVLSFVRKCIALTPTDRFENSQACLTALRSLSTPSEISSSTEIIQSFLESRSPSFELSRQSSKSHKSWFAFASLLLLAIISFFLIRHYYSSTPITPSPISSIPTPMQSPAQPPESLSTTSQTPPNSALVTTSRHSMALSRSNPDPPLKMHPKASAVPTTPIVVPKDSVSILIEQGRGFLSAGRPADALASFQSALKTPSSLPRQGVVRSCVYWSAKSTTALFKQGLVPSTNFIASWQSVLNLYPVGSAEHIEAESALKEGVN